jgi:outer membrane biosynthesis protein TonB
LVSNGDDDENFLQRNKAVLIFFAIVLSVVGWVVFSKPLGSSGPVRREQEQQVVKIVLPPPPPPPPPKATPPPPPPKEDKRPEQAPLAAPDKPVAQPKPAAKPPEGLGTNIKGAGPGLAGLSGGGGNGMIGGTGSGPGGGGSPWSGYAGKVQARIAEALRANARTRSASLNIQVRVWPDSSGKIARVQVVGTSGDSALDNALRNEVLSGLNLNEAPPAGMPVPIVLRLVARRPN